MSTLHEINERDYWLFGELCSVLIAFADDPRNVIARIGGGQISIPDDQANHLHEFYRTILANYPQASELETMRVAKQIDEMLDERSRNRPLFDSSFWTNDGFIHHPDWDTIRALARTWLVR